MCCCLEIFVSRSTQGDRVRARGCAGGSTRRTCVDDVAARDHGRPAAQNLSLSLCLSSRPSLAPLFLLAPSLPLSLSCSLPSSPSLSFSPAPPLSLLLPLPKILYAYFTPPPSLYLFPSLPSPFHPRSTSSTSPPRASPRTPPPIPLSRWCSTLLGMQTAMQSTHPTHPIHAQ